MSHDNNAPEPGTPDFFYQSRTALFRFMIEHVSAFSLVNAHAFTRDDDEERALYGVTVCQGEDDDGDEVFPVILWKGKDDSAGSIMSCPVSYYPHLFMAIDCARGIELLPTTYLDAIIDHSHNRVDDTFDNMVAMLVQMAGVSDGIDMDVWGDVFGVEEE